MSNNKESASSSFGLSKLKRMVKKIPVPKVSINQNKDRSAATTQESLNEPSTAQPEPIIKSFQVNEADQQPFIDCDALFNDCEEFLTAANETIEFRKKQGKSTMGKLVPGQINKWRAKRKGNNLFDTFDSLQSRITSTETSLNEISESSTQNTTALITQSIHLNSRLSSCIKFNRTEISKGKPALQAGKDLCLYIKSYEENIASMIDFIDEITELKRSEPVAYVPWALRQQMEAEAEAELKAAMEDTSQVEVKQSSLDRKMRKIQQILPAVEEAVGRSETEHTTRMDNLSHCLRSQLALLNFLHRYQSGAIIASATGIAGGFARTVSAPGAFLALPVVNGRSITNNQNAGRTTPANSSSSSSSSSPNSPSAGIVSTNNPISSYMTFNHGAAAAAASASNDRESQSSEASHTSRLSGVDAVMGKLSFSFNHGAAAAAAGEGRPSEMNTMASKAATGGKSRNKHTSTKGGATQQTQQEQSKEQSFSFDDDEEEEHDEDEDEEEDEEGGGDGIFAGDSSEATQLRAIEKSIRHMNMALANMQKSSGLGFDLGEVVEYDHSSCDDCRGTYTMANDCCMHLAAANYRAKQCSERQLRLGVVKDRIQTRATELDAMDWGGEVGSGVADTA
mmetsp:Transcript_12592/g.20939  ORF Transcript_12592/g.20939 Transcript_12592/m.20939 type:complete len:624 (+) Transcript_12592:78-1949(+)